MLSLPPLQSNNSLYTGDDMLVVIDPGVSNYDCLAMAISSKAEVVLLDPHEDAISQITAALHSFNKPFSNLHIIVECVPGTLNFTYGDFSFQTLKRYVNQLQKWFVNTTSKSPQQTPQVFIYGRQVTTNEVGRQFMDTLAWLTGASVVTASTYAQT